MAKFRKKPVVIEAFQLPQRGDYDLSAFHAWAFEVGFSNFQSEKDETMTIHTLEDGADGRAVHVADPGDWIIKSVKGEFYPCKPDIFSATYEPA